ncbi:hypothetical protein [Thauera humireducens]|uniref:hypothetical protein n=1 Tax=Thauera humireducens TaxID=1134435 RepID=UPI00311FB420
MSIRVDTSSLITGAVVVGDPGLGVLAEQVPTTGEHGGGIAATWLGPEDAGKEVRVLVTSWPAVGSLFVFEDTSFDYDGPGSTFEAQLYLDGVAVGSPQPVTITVGAGTTVSPSAGAITSTGYAPSIQQPITLRQQQAASLRRATRRKSRRSAAFGLRLGISPRRATRQRSASRARCRPLLVTHC